MLTQEYVRQLFDYVDGVLYWRVARTKRLRVGDVAGYARACGRRTISIDGRLHYAHRLVYLYHFGTLPDELDHIDGNPGNNRVENLRSATRCQNQYNAGLRRDNVSGIKGVHWYKQTNRWRAVVRVDGKHRSVGYFKSLADACAAVRAYREARHGEFARSV
jgi:hypothetical protein